MVQSGMDVAERLAFLVLPRSYSEEYATGVVRLTMGRARLLRIRRANEHWRRALSLTPEQEFTQGDYVDGW